MKRRRIIGLILGLLVILALVIYHLPVQRTISMSVSSVDGEQKQLEMRLNCYRHLIGATTVRGTMFLDGVEYRDHEYVMEHYFRSDESFFSSWMNSEDFYNMDFYKVPPEDALASNPATEYFHEVFANRIIFFDVSSGLDFEKLHFSYLDASVEQGVSYYGPAKTAGEAIQIAKEFGWNVD